MRDASARGRATLEGHGAEVNALAFSPDGKRLAVGDPDGGLRVLESSPIRASP